MKHFDSLNDEVTSTYSIGLDQSQSNPITAYKDVKKRTETDKPEERGLLSAINTPNEVIYKKEPLDTSEQTALLHMIKSL